MTTYNETSVSKTFADAGFVKVGCRYYNPVAGCFLRESKDAATFVGPGYEISNEEGKKLNAGSISLSLIAFANKHPEYLLACGKIGQYSTGPHNLSNCDRGIALFKEDQIIKILEFPTGGTMIELKGIPDYIIFLEDEAEKAFLDWLNGNKETVSTAEHLGAPGSMSDAAKITEAINQLKEETKAKERQRAIRSLKYFLSKKFTGTQAFNTEDLGGDSKQTVYDQDGIKILFCPSWDYLEIFGLSAEEFRDLLKDSDDFFGDHIRTFTPEEMGMTEK